MPTIESIYDGLPAEFKISEDPTEIIRLWRGDKIGRHVTGMSCSLGDTGAAVSQVYEGVSRGVSGVNELIDIHTDGNKISPFVSVTNDIVRAQAYCNRPGETIFELCLPASRLIRDPYNIGSPFRKNNDTEFFVVGSIEPSEITALKANNHDWKASDLLFERKVRGCLLTFSADPLTDRDYRHNPDQLPNPAGIWEQIAA